MIKYIIKSYYFCLNINAKMVHFYHIFTNELSSDDDIEIYDPPSEASENE